MEQTRHPFRVFFLCNYLIVMALTLWVDRHALQGPGWTSPLFVLAAVPGYALLYLSPAMLLSWLARRFVGYRPAVFVALTSTTATLVLLLADARIHDLYGFHINGFVWNLLMTPGGLSSMGGGESANLTAVLVVVAILVLQLLLWMKGGCGLPALVGRPWRYALAVVVLTMVGERAVYGVSHLRAYQPVLQAARGIPFYQPTTFRGAAMELGLKPVRDAGVSVSRGEGRLAYPRAPLRREASAPSPNIVWLVAESLRWDMLDPEIMPNLWAFSEGAHRFENHYSGGNGTRMGIFSLFYGLPGSYWFSFLDERRSPAFMDELRRRDYRLGLYTSARFTYPEFDKTVFVGVPSDRMISDERGPGWQRDRRNVDRLLDFLGDDGGRPFFAFMFLESAHARYYFPEESVIRQDYLRDFNYATVDVEEEASRIFNRYINASHHLDAQIGRVLDSLREKGMLENTIVMVTGDHGEEFMEKGRWGHNSAFHNEQVHTPLVVWAPGYRGRVFDHPTSHVDLVPTLMPMMGVTNPVEDYALGRDLHDASSDRYRLSASWDAVAYLGPDYKVAMPLAAGGLFEMSVARADDRPVADAGPVIGRLRDRLAAVLDDLSRFYRKH